MAIRILYPSSQAVNLANDEIATFARTYKPGASEGFNNGEDHFMMRGVTLRWKSDKPFDAYTVCLSMDKSFTKCLRYHICETSVLIHDLLVGQRYFWQVTAQNIEGEETSEIVEFTTLVTARTINLKGVSNTRDLGGCGNLRQGMVYRGGRLDDITEDGKVAAREIYGIKTDLDLRNMAEGTAGLSSPLGEEIHYVHVNESPYYLGGNVGIDVEKNKQILAQSVKVFAVAENYPIYVHCSLGRDRTAAVCLLIEGLLGKNEKDILMDYELSFFSKMGSLDKQTVGSMLGMFQKMYAYLQTYSKESFAQACENYLLSAGVTQEEISTIRSLLAV